VHPPGGRGAGEMGPAVAGPGRLGRRRGGGGQVVPQPGARGGAAGRRRRGGGPGGRGLAGGLRGGARGAHDPGEGGGLMEPSQVIIRPVVTEKSYALAAAGKYT